MYMEEIVWNGVDWFNLAVDVDKWRASLNTVTDILLHEMGAICCISDTL
jgi:hypothetical protein